MVFVNSLRLLRSNWSKALKFFLYYIVVWGICIALFLPVAFEFEQIFSSNFNEISGYFAGVFKGNLGENLHGMIVTAGDAIVDIFDANVGLAIYGLIVVFVILPFVINVGKYTLECMLYSYMTSKNQIGFFSAFVKNLKKSVLFALCKVGYNLIFLAITISAVFGLGLVEDETFVRYLLPLAEILVLVLLFTLNQILVLGWAPASIVFDCGVFTAFRKGVKAVRRHFWKIFGVTFCYFLLFWALVMIFGVYTMIVLVPVMTILLTVYNMTVFFTSQGMRFYVNDSQILTPKKLEEVDNINKTAFLL